VNRIGHGVTVTASVGSKLGYQDLHDRTSLILVAETCPRLLESKGMAMAAIDRCDGAGGLTVED